MSLSTRKDDDDAKTKTTLTRGRKGGGGRRGGGGPPKPLPVGREKDAKTDDDVDDDFDDDGRVKKASEKVAARAESFDAAESMTVETL